MNRHFFPRNPNSPRNLWGLVFPLLIFLTVTACSGELFAQPTGPAIRIANQTGADICEVYISPAEAADWGLSLLPQDDRISAGAEKTFQASVSPADLLVRNCQAEVVYSQSEITSSVDVVIGGPQTNPLRLVNNTPTEVCYVYIVPAGQTDWGPDQLGGVESVLAGEARLFYLTPGRYNLRATACDDTILSEHPDREISQPDDWMIQP